MDTATLEVNDLLFSLEEIEKMPLDKLVVEDLDVVIRHIVAPDRSVAPVPVASFSSAIF